MSDCSRCAEVDVIVKRMVEREKLGGNIGGTFNTLDTHRLAEIYGHRKPPHWTDRLSPEDRANFTAWLETQETGS